MTNIVIEINGVRHKVVAEDDGKGCAACSLHGECDKYGDVCLCTLFCNKVFGLSWNGNYRFEIEGENRHAAIDALMGDVLTDLEDFVATGRALADKLRKTDNG